MKRRNLPGATISEYQLESARWKPGFLRLCLPCVGQLKKAGGGGTGSGGGAIEEEPVRPVDSHGDSLAEDRLFSRVSPNLNDENRESSRGVGEHAGATMRITNQSYINLFRNGFFSRQQNEIEPPGNIVVLRSPYELKSMEQDELRLQNRNAARNSSSSLPPPAETVLTSIIETALTKDSQPQQSEIDVTWKPCRVKDIVNFFNRKRSRMETITSSADQPVFENEQTISRIPLERTLKNSLRSK